MSRLVKKKIKEFVRVIKPFQPKWLTSKFSNVDYNRNLWDDYAQKWEKRNIPLEDPGLSKKEIKMLGEEWGNLGDMQQVVREFIIPYIDARMVVAEIGTGGGRVASIVAPKVNQFTCFDISSEMLKKAKNTLQSLSNVDYCLLQQPKFSGKYKGYFDFIYSFDVFVHLDLHTIWKYFQGIHRVLKPGARCFLHTTNLKAPDGWQRFSGQDEYAVEGHYFISPEIIDVLVQRIGFQFIKSSKIDASNFYYNRDYLFVLQK